MGAMAKLRLPVAARLAELEAIIEQGLATFVGVAQALLEVRDTRLYRESHPTFEDYCRERWGFSRQRAHQHIDAAVLSTMVDKAGLPAPTNERQARELAPLRNDPERMAEAWAEANGDGQPTALEVRDAVARTRGQLANQAGGSDAWETPQDLFDELDAEFGFDLDVCAQPSSAKSERFFSPEQDGLAQDWRGACWMNPPYGQAIGAWVAKARLSARAGATVVCLLPARVDTGWWWDHCRYGEVRFLRGRLKFGGSPAGAPFPSVVVIFGPGVEPCVRWWER